MKSYTDLEQSKRLAEILPLDSADMSYTNNKLKKEVSANLSSIIEMQAYFDNSIYDWDRFYELTPCWSLAALLDYLSANFHIDIKYLDTQWELDCRVQVSYAEELIDACVEMILKLKEKDLI